MTPAENAMRLALLVLKEVAGETRITNGDEEGFRYLLREVKDAAHAARMDVTDLYAFVMHGLAKANAPLFHRLQRMSELKNVLLLPQT